MYDRIDQRILDLLQGDCTLPISSIAESVGLSTTPCWRRIRRMEEAGLIQRRVALVDRAACNVPLTVFAAIRAPSHSLEWLEAFRAAIDDIPEIVEAYRLAGDIDYLLRIVAPDIATYDAVYKRLVSRLDFGDVSSSISMEELKYTTAVPTGYLVR